MLGHIFNQVWKLIVNWSKQKQEYNMKQYRINTMVYQRCYIYIYIMLVSKFVFEQSWLELTKLKVDIRNTQKENKSNNFWFSFYIDLYFYLQLRNKVWSRFFWSSSILLTALWLININFIYMWGKAVAIDWPSILLRLWLRMTFDINTYPYKQ